ncbi:calcium-binding protein [Donghicola sp. XS_ASV15]|uniref:calcium-binding protein n=1 Tax=Donghicola sp. XS_ASV15 TaxID=3241295 RepID=UPI0035154E67
MSTVNVLDQFATVLVAGNVDVTATEFLPMLPDLDDYSDPVYYEGGTETDTFEFGGTTYSVDIVVDEVQAYETEQGVLGLAGFDLSDTNPANGTVTAVIYVWEDDFTFDFEALVFVTSTPISEADIMAHLNSGLALSEVLLAGNDLIAAEEDSGPSKLYGFGGNDTMYASGGNISLFGGSGNDVLIGSAKRNKLVGGTGADVIDGMAGNDRIFGGADNDVLRGGRGRDRVNGNKGNDHLEGGAGKDRLKGGAGNDTLFGDAGRDTLVGGAGSDSFVFADNSGKDTIRDFNVMQDTLDFSSSYVSSLDDLNIFQKGDDVIVKYDGGKITLLGVEVEDVLGSDIAFV